MFEIGVSTKRSASKDALNSVLELAEVVAAVESGEPTQDHFDVTDTQQETSHFRSWISIASHVIVICALEILPS